MKKWAVLGLALLFGATLLGAPSPAAAELKVGVSGYVKLDVQYNDKVFGTGGPSPRSVPLDTNKEADNSELLFTARQTRFRITATDEVAGVKMVGRVEADFFGTSAAVTGTNSHGLRLRHAYAEAFHPGGFFLLAGQTFSIFLDDIAALPTLDFGGPVGGLSSRQPQLRVGVKSPLGGQIGDLVFMAAIEGHSLNNLGSTAVDESAGSAQDLPLLAGKVQLLGKVFKAEAALALANNRVVLDGGKRESEAAWGGLVGVSVNLAPFTISGHYNHLDGLARVLSQGVTVNSAGLTAASKVENVEADNFYVGLGVSLTKDTSANLIYGWSKVDENTKIAQASGSALELGRGVHVNLLHKFWQRWQAGIEYQRVWVETFSGVDGDVNVIHGAIFLFF